MFERMTEITHPLNEELKHYFANKAKSKIVRFLRRFLNSEPSQYIIKIWRRRQEDLT